MKVFLEVNIVKNKIMSNSVSKICLNFLNFLSKIYQFIIYCYSYIAKKIIIGSNNNNLPILVSNHFIYYPTPVSLTYAWRFGFLAGMCLLIQMISGIFFSNNNTLKFLLVKKEKLMQYLKKNFNFKNGKYVFFAIFVFVMLHLSPFLTIVFSIFLIPTLHIVPSFKKYFIYKYILIFILIYVPIGFYFYIKWLIIVGVELIDISGIDYSSSNLVTVKNNCVTVDINFLSMNYWKWRFIMIPLMKLPFFKVYISKWFFLTFINQIYTLGAIFSHLSGIPISILVYV